jgi:RNA recognition motif-containing protein
MKEALTAIFKHYGPILDIVVKKSLKRKGQAFVVFDSEKSVLGAVEEMTGFEMYGKVLKVAKARTHSDETVIRKAPAIFEEHKRKRLMLKGKYFDLRLTYFRVLMCNLQTLSAPKRIPKPRPTQRQRQTSLAQSRLELLSFPTNTYDQTRHSSCRMCPRKWTRKLSRPSSSASKVSKKSAQFLSRLWLLQSLRTSSSPLRQRKRQQICLLDPRASK